MSGAAPLAVTHVAPFGDYEGQIVFSGAENHLFQLMAGQKSAGLDVELLMLVTQDGPRLQAKADELRDAGIAVTRFLYHRSFLPLLGRAAWVAQLPRLVAVMRKRRQRIIHTHLPHASQLGRVAAWAGGVRAIVDSVHNDDPFYSHWSWRMRLKALRYLPGPTIAISHRVKNHLVNAACVPAGRVVVVPYGVEPPRQVDRAGARAALGLPRDAFVVGFVGRLTAQKDLGTLMGAMAALPEVHLCLVGAGPEEENMRRQAERIGSSRVHFAGARPNAADLMPAFDVLALTSKWEGLGLVLLEAMARGVPIAATRGGAIPEVLEEGRLGLLSDVGDAAGMAGNIRRLRADPAERDELIARGLSAVSLRHSIPAMVQATTAVYQAICPSPAVRPR